MIFTAGGMHAYHGKDQKGGEKPAQDIFLRSLITQISRWPIFSGILGEKN
jgi:hypothetical protein